MHFMVFILIEVLFPTALIYLTLPGLGSHVSSETLAMAV